MVESNPTYIPEATSDTIDYKPLSLLAVAGFTVAVLYAVGVLIYAIAAFVQGEPLLLDYMALALPAGAAVLACLGLWQIHGSEGTRAGSALAKWGLGISLVFGLGYITYETFTKLAIVQQANRFLVEKADFSGFFPRLAGSDTDVRIAFLYLLGDLAERDVRVDDAREMDRFDLPVGQNPKGPLTQFLESPLVCAVRAAAPGSVQVEPLAVRSWTYENRAYNITRLYRITTDEAVYEVPIGVVSIEPKAEGEKRRWRVDHMTILAPLQPVRRTPLGEQRQGLRQKALEFLGDPQTGWFTNLRYRRGLEVYLGTLPASQRKAVRNHAAAIRAGTTGQVADDDLWSRHLPGYQPLSDVADLFKMDNIRTRAVKLLPDVQAAAKEALTPNRLPWLDPRVLPNDMAPCEIKGGEVLVTHQAEMIVNLPSPKGDAAMLLVLKVILAAPEDIDPNEANASQEWRVKSVEIVRALGMPPRKQ